MVARNATVADVMNVLSEKEQISYVLSGVSTSAVSFSLQDVPAPKALTAILAVSGHTWTERNGIVHVMPGNQQGSQTVSPEYSGKVIRQFDLDFASAKDVHAVVEKMISATGKSFFVESNPKDIRKTGESIIIEDQPGVVERIGKFISQADKPPRQVLIEAYVLEVDLEEDARHGVNFENIARIAGNDIRLGTIGVTPTATSTFFAEIDAPDLKGLIDALKVSTDTKTLASPKLMVVNGQESLLQVGQQLGFRVIQQNGNTSLEDVKFLNVGVVLSVTPRISRDGRVLMHVKPEVSSGEINTDTGLPEEETSEVETSVLLSNGKGMVIGGLIQEKDSIIESKVPWLGDLKGVGGLFRRTAKEKSRSEIVFVLIPRVVEFEESDRIQNEINRQHSQLRSKSEYIRSTTPLFEPQECDQPRPSFHPPLSPIHREYNGTDYRSHEQFPREMEVSNELTQAGTPVPDGAMSTPEDTSRRARSSAAARPPANRSSIRRTLQD